MEEVGEIVDRIADIFDQTNLLALNANIEGARASEAGEGLPKIGDTVESQTGDSEQVSSVIENTVGMTEKVTASIQQISSGIDEQSQPIDDVAHRAEQVSPRSD
ncbi:MAG: methyl-accepting chemotaxis protein [archaeon]